MVKVTQDFIVKGSKNRPALKNPIKFVTVHNTGNSSKGAGAKNHASYVKSESAQKVPVSWHYTVDDKEIYQHLPESETAYHAGDGNGNGNKKSIGVEICMNEDGDILKATNNAVELVADICIRNGITAENVKQHFDWTGKDCPQMIRSGKPYDWNTFMDKLKKLLSDFATEEVVISSKDELYRIRKAWQNSDTQVGAYSILENAKKVADELNGRPEYFVFDSKGNIVYPK